MNWTILLPLGLAIVLIFLAMQVKPINWTDERASNRAMMVQFMIYSLSYLLMVIGSAALDPNKSGQILFLIVMDIMALCALIKLSGKTRDANRIPIQRPYMAKAILKIIAFTWFGLFSLLSILNYSFVIMFPSAYSVEESTNIYSIAFDSVYYTFSIMLSYSGAGITAIDFFSKTIEMIEVLFSYITIGVIVTNVISKASEYK